VGQRELARTISAVCWVRRAGLDQHQLGDQLELEQAPRHEFRRTRRGGEERSRSEMAASFQRASAWRMSGETPHALKSHAGSSTSTRPFSTRAAKVCSGS
jgi:hypothetical protein